MAQELLTIIEEQTEKYVKTGKLSLLTTGELSRKLGQKRNTVSKQLNRLVERHKLIKITTRPVIYLSKSVLLAHDYHVNQRHYGAVEELAQQVANPLRGLIGSEGSLLLAVQQIESALMYPDNGLPFILFGETGSGKSLIARLSYEFAISQGCIKQGPFVTLNCAQYADNPELLSSILFGYKQGAFTGADQDKEGLLGAADGGILFLDEVHRLSPESQEKLFIFIDQGVYTPLGEVKKVRRATVRLIFATTENKEAFLLATFMRRIPILIDLPNLGAKSDKERLELIYYFFREESVRMNMVLSISNQLIHVLLHYPFKGNVGELKNTIKYLCAYQYRKQNKQAQLVINTSILPEKMLPLPELDVTGKTKNIIISKKTTLSSLNGLSTQVETGKVDQLFAEIVQAFKDEEQSSATLFLGNVLSKVDLLMDSLVFNQPKESNHLLLQIINKRVKAIVDFLEDENGLLLFSNGTFAIANYLFYRIQETILEDEPESEAIIGLRCFLMTKYASAYEGAKNMMLLLENKFELKLTNKDEIILALYMISSTVHYWQENRIKSLILAHGFATASSLANLGNRMLKKHLFDAFDMQLNSTTQEIGKSVDEYIKKNSGCEEFIILVDMGSLQEIKQFVQIRDNVTIGIINNVTTAMVLQVGELLLAKKSPEEIISQVKAHFFLESQLHIAKQEKHWLIITTCMTGIGTAIHLKKMLADSFAMEDEIEIEAMDFQVLKNDGLNKQFSDRQVLAIIGTDNPEISECLYIPLEQLISGEGDVLTEALSGVFSAKKIAEINRKLIKNFSLEKVIDSITILDSQTVLNQIEEVLQLMEKLLNRQIENRIQMTLYVHIGCLVERLIRNQPILTYPEEQQEQIPESFFAGVQNIFSGIEMKYSVTIPQAELCYIYDILNS